MSTFERGDLVKFVRPSRYMKSTKYLLRNEKINPPTGSIGVVTEVATRGYNIIPTVMVRWFVDAPNYYTGYGQNELELVERGHREEQT